MGKLIGSADKAEFFMEPPLFGALATLFLDERIPDTLVEKLAENLIVRDLVYQRLAGRTFNFNSNDDSYVFGFKSQNVVESVLSQSWSENLCFEKSKNIVCVIKSPDVFIIKSFERFLDKISKVVIIKRNPISIYNSIVNKRWYFDDWKTPFLNGPFRSFQDQDTRLNLLPIWFDRGEEQFNEMSAYDKSALHVLAMYEEGSLSANVTSVFYENICNRKLYVDNLFKSLGLTKTLQTERAILAIEPLREVGNLGHLENLSADLRDRLELISDSHEKEMMSDPLI